MASRRGLHVAFRQHQLCRHRPGTGRPVALDDLAEKGRRAGCVHQRDLQLRPRVSGQPRSHHLRRARHRGDGSGDLHPHRYLAAVSDARPRPRGAHPSAQPAAAARAESADGPRTRSRAPPTAASIRIDFALRQEVKIVDELSYAVISAAGITTLDAEIERALDAAITHPGEPMARDEAEDCDAGDCDAGDCELPDPAEVGEKYYSTSEVARFFGGRSAQWVYWAMRTGVFTQSDGTVIEPLRIGKSGPAPLHRAGAARYGPRLLPPWHRQRARAEPVVGAGPPRGRMGHWKSIEERRREREQQARDGVPRRPRITWPTSRWTGRTATVRTNRRRARRSPT